MRKFVFLLLLALGFSVCFALPPPAEPQSDVTIVDQITVDQSINLPPVTPCIMQDQQPAPLLTAIRHDNVVRINCLSVDLPPGIGLLPDIIQSNTINDNDLRHTCQAKDNLTPVLTHSSGGLPY